MSRIYGQDSRDEHACERLSPGVERIVLDVASKSPIASAAKLGRAMMTVAPQIRRHLWPQLLTSKRYDEGSMVEGLTDESPDSETIGRFLIGDTVRMSVWGAALSVVNMPKSSDFDDARARLHATADNPVFMVKVWFALLVNDIWIRVAAPTEETVLLMGCAITPGFRGDFLGMDSEGMMSFAYTNDEAKEGVARWLKSGDSDITETLEHISQTEADPSLWLTSASESE